MAVYGLTSRRAIAGCLYGAIVTGCFYGFSMYSRALKKQFGLSQSQLDNINTVPYAFGLLSPLFGKLSILLGPRLSILLGGLWCAAWQLVLFLLATKRLVLPSVAPSLSLVVASIFVYNGVQLVSAAVFSTPVVHFPRQRGQAASLVKSFVGLGATVVAQLYVLGFGVPDDGPDSRLMIGPSLRPPKDTCWLIRSCRFCSSRSAWIRWTTTCTLCSRFAIKPLPHLWCTTAGAWTDS